MDDADRVRKETIDMLKIKRANIIDGKRKVRIVPELRDKEGEEVDVSELAGEINDLLAEQMKPVGDGELSEIQGKVYPMVSQFIFESLHLLGGDELAALLLGDRIVRETFINLGMMTFFFTRIVDRRGLKITTTEESISEEEVDRAYRIDFIAETLTKAETMGVSPKAAIAEMVKRGLLTRNDLKAIGFSDEEADIVVNAYRAETEEDPTPEN